MTHFKKRKVPLPPSAPPDESESLYEQPDQMTEPQQVTPLFVPQPELPPRRKPPPPVPDQDDDMYEVPDEKKEPQEITDNSGDLYLEPTMKSGRPQVLRKGDSALESEQSITTDEILAPAPAARNHRKQRPPKFVDTVVLRRQKSGLKPVKKLFDVSCDHDDAGNEESSTSISEEVANKNMLRSLSEPATKPEPAARPRHRFNSASGQPSADDGERSSNADHSPCRRRTEHPLPPPPEECPARPGQKGESSYEDTLKSLQYDDASSLFPISDGIGTESSVEDEPWFFEIQREETGDKLNGIDGMFLVRPSKRGGFGSPYTLCLYHNNRIYHLNIRRRQDNTFALGTPRPNEQTFKTVAELIDYHHQYPIKLAGTENNQVLLIEHPLREGIYDQTA